MATDELLLLDRVFLRIVSTNNEEQLESALGKFLPSILVKLSSGNEGVRKKVMELLVHVNKRLKHEKTVQLPIEALLVQYQDPAASSFITNFTIIYLKTGFPRLPVHKQIDLIPTVLNSIEGKPESHQDSLLLLLVPVLGQVQVSPDPSQRKSMFGLNEKPTVRKQLLSILLDILLLPYGALNSQTVNAETQPQPPPPPAFSEASYKRITSDAILKSENLENIRLGIVKFLAHGIINEDEIVLHLVVAAADTHFAVANLADMELRKIVATVNWSSTSVTMPFYNLYLGTKAMRFECATLPHKVKSPAPTRIKLKILASLNRVTGEAFAIPFSTHVIFDALFGPETTVKLGSLALNFASNFICNGERMSVGIVGKIFLQGLQRLINNAESPHRAQAFVVLNDLLRRKPWMMQNDFALLEQLFRESETATPELRGPIHNAMVSLIQSFIWGRDDHANALLDLKSIEQNALTPDKAKTMTPELRLLGLLSHYLKSPESSVRVVTVKYAASRFFRQHVCARYLMAVAAGDVKDEVANEARVSLYKHLTEEPELESSTGKSSTPQTEPWMFKKFPNFLKLVAFVHKESRARKHELRKFDQVSANVFGFTARVYGEIATYLRMCLYDAADVPLERDLVAAHPCECTPKLAGYLSDVANTSDVATIRLYVCLVLDYLQLNPGLQSMNNLVEIIGCLPTVICKEYETKLEWIQNFTSYSNEELRERAAVAYGILATSCLTDADFDAKTRELINSLKSSKVLEVQHGALLSLANAFERKITQRVVYNELETEWPVFKDGVVEIVNALSNANTMIVNAACMAIGLLARCCALPLPSDGDISPSKLSVVKRLFEIMNNNKLTSKVRERASKALGLLCVGEVFPHEREIIQGLINTSKETKDVDVHLAVGESLVMTVQSIQSVEARDAWRVTPDNYIPKSVEPNNNLDWLLDELIKMVAQPHPNQRQASCLWLLALLKNCSDRDAIKSRLMSLQTAFNSLLGENNDIVQDSASKGLSLIYENSDESMKKEILEVLLGTLQSGRREVQKVTTDTKLFEEGQLGKSPTGGNLSTYKELCSLASDLNKPDLIYKFMHLANHNAIWNSKKGAAFGFSEIAAKCSDQIKPYLPKIIPRLYRYQFDPTPNLQNSMSRIWQVLVPDKNSALDVYFDEILDDIVSNMTSHLWRVRQSCCLALIELLRAGNRRTIHDCTRSIAEIWKELYRVMDDVHEATRKVAITTANKLSKICVYGCRSECGAKGEKLMTEFLPVILGDGITHAVFEVRVVSLHTVSQLATTAGAVIKPFLPTLIPALLEATGELESTKLSQLSTMYGAQSDVQESIDNARASAVKSNYLMDTLKKCLEFLDVEILEKVAPQVMDIMKRTAALPTKIGCSRFIILMMGHENVRRQQNPKMVAKMLQQFLRGLRDRNAVVRKQHAQTIAYLIEYAKDSTIENLFKSLEEWYFDDLDSGAIIAYTIDAMSVKNQDHLKGFMNQMLPFAFFAMHIEKDFATTVEKDLWTKIWDENCPGNETGINQNIIAICDFVKKAFCASNWSVKSRGASVITTIATKVGATLEPNLRIMLVKLIMDNLPGRTWDGKEQMVRAIAALCVHCKDLKTDSEIDTDAIASLVFKECTKNDLKYRRQAIEAIGDILEAFELDRFDELYKCVQADLMRNTNKINKSDSEGETGADAELVREQYIKIKETVYECLGKAWPKSTATQEKYRITLVEHCTSSLPVSLRTIQEKIILAEQKYVKKLLLLEQTFDQSTSDENKDLLFVINNIMKSVRVMIETSRYFRLKKESLILLLELCKRLKDKRRNAELDIISNQLDEMKIHLESDASPELQNVIVEIKKLLRTD